LPELPEVETIRRELQSRLRGRTFASVDVPDRTVLTGIGPSGRPRRRASAAGLASRLVGTSVRRVLRRGKYLVFELSSGESLLCHLRMTGQLIHGRPRPGARIVFGFRGTADALAFYDTRRFGEVWLAADWEREPALRRMGPEPLEEGWDEERWGRDLRSSRAKVQAALLDQSRIAGLGNIYVTECLFLTGLRPTRRCRTLRRADVAPLLRNIRRVLRAGLKHRGVSFSSYRDASGRRGRAQDHLWVYGRAGEPCRRCRTTIEDARVSGRGTAYCPRCQV
jgi:formamidopyrimidine-DNA glycosylase